MQLTTRRGLPAPRTIAAALATTGAMILALLPMTSSIAVEADPPAVQGETLAVMGEYLPAEFVDEAAALPPGLTEALDRDVDLTPAEYLANSAAAVDAVAVVESLVEAGTEVLGSRMEGSTLVVNLPDATEVEVVESTGAVAEVGPPPPAPDDSDAVYLPAHDVYNGQPWTWADSTYQYQCSVGLNGYRVSDGQKQFVTAGHCFYGNTGLDMFQSKVGTVEALSFSQPGLLGTSPNDPDTNPNVFAGGIGDPVSGSVGFGNYRDVGRIAMTNASAVPKPQALNWGGTSTGAPLSGDLVPVYGTTKAQVGATMCKSGSRTGWTCGTVGAVDVTINAGSYLINSIKATTCLRPGDSGGLALIGNWAVGINSTTKDVACTDPTYFAGFFPIESTSAQSVRGVYGTSWEPAVAVSTPALDAPISATVTKLTTVTGTLANASAQSSVGLYLDGSNTPAATASASTGAFSFTLAGIAGGAHTYRVVGLYGSWSKSTGAVTGSFTMSGDNPPNAFVKAVYQDVLGRLPGDGERAGWVNALSIGMPPWQVAGGFVNSDEFRLKNIDFAYRDVLGREPESGGRLSWLNGMRSGALSPDDAYRIFMQTQEYYNNAGGTIDSFVAAVYLKIIKRPAAPEEIAYWAGLVRQYGRATVVNLIWFSVETERARVSDMFDRYLGRPATYTDLVYWGDRGLQYGDTWVRGQLIGSGEYWSRASIRFP